MKITYKTTKPGQCYFKDLTLGETFYDIEGDLCLKINTNGIFNAVSLLNNFSYQFTEDYLVTPVQTELIVDAEEV